MKKNIKLLIIVGAAAVVLVGVMLLLLFLPKGEQDGTATYDEGVKLTVSVDKNGEHQAQVETEPNGEIKNNSYGTLLEYIPAKIESIHVENSNGTLDVKSHTPVNDDGTTEATEYTLVGFEDYTLRTGMAENIANDAAQLTFSKVATVKKDEGKDYGFDKVRATVTVKYNDNTSAVIIVGNDAPQGAGSYVKFGDGDEVYVVETEAVDSFLYDLTDMMPLEINDSADNEDNSKASSIEISGTNFPQPIRLVPNTNENNSASYQMTSPVKGYASESESSSLEGAIRGLYAESVKLVNPSSSQLKELGLDNPYAKLKAVYPDTTVELIASKPDGDGRVRLMIPGGKLVYEMNTEKLAWVVTSEEKLSDEYVIRPQLSKVSKAVVNNGKNDYTFDISTKETTTTNDDGEESTTTTTTVKCGSDELNSAYFTVYFQNLSMLKKADASTDKVSSKPLLTVTYTYASDSSTDTVKFYDNGSNRYVAELNGVVVGHVYKASITKLISQTDTIASNKEVEFMQ